MWAFLGWIYDRAGRVYLFFGTLYSRIRDAALHALDWAVTEGVKAFNRAVYAAQQLVWIAKYEIFRTIDAAATAAAQLIIMGVAFTLRVRNSILAFYDAVKKYGGYPAA